MELKSILPKSILQVLLTLIVIFVIYSTLLINIYLKSNLQLWEETVKLLSLQTMVIKQSCYSEQYDEIDEVDFH